MIYNNNYLSDILNVSVIKDLIEVMHFSKSFSVVGTRSATKHFYVKEHILNKCSISVTFLYLSRSYIEDLT